MPIAIDTDENGTPIRVIWRGRRVGVAAVIDRWRIDDEWWRQPISRLYHRLALADDRLFTVFRDLIGGGWYVQRYRFSRQQPAVNHQRRAGRQSRSRRAAS